MRFADFCNMKAGGRNRREAVRQYLLEHPLLRVTVAQRLGGIHPSAVSRVLHGRRRNETIEAFIKEAERAKDKEASA